MLTATVFLNHCLKRQKWQVIRPTESKLPSLYMDVTLYSSCSSSLLGCVDTTRCITAPRRMRLNGAVSVHIQYCTTLTKTKPAQLPLCSFSGFYPPALTLSIWSGFVTLNGFTLPYILENAFLLRTSILHPKCPSLSMQIFSLLCFCHSLSTLYLMI